MVLQIAKEEPGCGRSPGCERSLAVGGDWLWEETGSGSMDSLGGAWL